MIRFSYLTIAVRLARPLSKLVKNLQLGLDRTDVLVVDLRLRVEERV